MHYYDHHIGDYRRDTSALSVTEHGVYRLLLDEAYATERPLPSDHAALCRIVRAQNKAERDAVALVARQFFTQEGEGLRHKRVDEEITLFRERSAAAAAKGRKSGESRRSRRANAVAGVEQDVNRSSTAVQPELNSSSTGVEPTLNYPVPSTHKNASHSAHARERTHAEGHEWLNSLRAKYPDIDVDAEWVKAREWYDSRALVCTRAKFEDWLTRAEPSLPKAPKPKKLTEMSEAERLALAKKLL